MRSRSWPAGACKGELVGGLTALFWAGLVRIFLVHHVTFSINSICHFFGRRRFSTDDQSTNVFWLALPSFGESWHHNHHAFPRSALHGLRWWEVDPGGWVIRAMTRLGLAWNVVLITHGAAAAAAAWRRSAAPAARARRAIDDSWVRGRAAVSSFGSGGSGVLPS